MCKTALKGTNLRLGIALALALAAVWFGFVDNTWLDRRPVHRLLFLGHSYTYYNDMPAMVAKMADSANSPIRYDITMSAFPNATLEEHWHNHKTRELLSQGGWHRVIAQPELSYRYEPSDSSLYVYGSKLLLGTAEQSPAVIISHLATDEFYRRINSTEPHSGHVAAFHANLRALATATGADVIDVARVWDRVRMEVPFSLYQDGNHPSLEGSYLAALVVYASIARADVTDVTYVPGGMSSEHAELLRERVQSALTESYS